MQEIQEADMAYDYNSRLKWEKARLTAWEESHKKEINRLSKEKRELFDAVSEFSRYPYSSFPVLVKWGREKTKAAAGKRTLKEIICEGCPELIDLLVPAEYREDFTYMLGEYVHFQYTRSVFRPTVRTADPAAHILDAFELMQAYKVLGMYGLTPAEYLTERHPDGTPVDAELLDFKRNDSSGRDLHMVRFEDILAARIDRGDEAARSAVRDAFLSDNNTVIVTVPLIRGVVKSRDAELHELLAKFLLAAKLQEGVRQAVCENADCGRPEAFLTILDTIRGNDLLRFSAVKRAAATWTGICSVDAMDRVSAKVFANLDEAVRNREKALEMTRTDDSVEIVIGLWALGFYEAKDAIDRMLEIAENGTKNQRLTISYYNRYMQSSDYSAKAAIRMIETYPDDPQMAAAFMPTYLARVDTIIRNCILDKNDKYVYSDFGQELHFISPDVSDFFDSEEQARRHYAILKNLADGMKKRKIEYEPMIFPWYGAVLDKCDLTQRMVLIAYTLKDQDMIDEVCLRLTDITDSYYNTRRNYLCVLLHDPKTKVQKDALLDYVADKESFTRTCAFELLKKLPLSGEDMERLTKHLRLKNEDTRRYVIELLETQDEKGVTESIRKLLISDKEQIRLAGLDMLKRRSEAGAEAKKAAAALLHEVLPDGEGLTDKERVLYNGIAGDKGTADILNTEGYGLYDPAAEYDPGLGGTDEKDGKKSAIGRALGFIFKNTGENEEQKLLRDYFSLTEKELDSYFDRIRAFVLEHGKMEYTSANGDRQLLENGLYLINYDARGELWTRYPFPELWDEVYETIIKEPEVLFNLYFAMQSGYDESTVKDIAAFRKAERTIFGDAWSGYNYADPKFKSSYAGRSLYQTVFSIIMSRRHFELPVGVARAAVLMAIRQPEEIRWMEKVPQRYQTRESKACFLRTNKFSSILSRISRHENDDEFRASFPILYEADRVYRFDDQEPAYGYTNSSGNILSIFSYVKAFELGIISQDFLYKAAFEMVGLKFAVDALGDFFRPNISYFTLMKLRNFMPVDLEKHTVDKESRFYQLCAEMYEKLVNLILDVELKRGDTPTVFSPAVPRIPRIQGISRLMEILRALGTDTLDRNAYYAYGSGTGKKECLSHLLKVCRPLPEETASDLENAVKQNKISRERLVEVAMYAPQWLDFTEEVLKMDGLKSGSYYFMAHMNERFDDRKKAVIARYTPLTTEELNDGCFDTNWFFEVYEKLGEKNFALLYKAAKYIADGSKHTRARKYADAATGRVDRDELEKVISDKRNKDLLMSYGLIPIKDRKDALHRYEFLQNFLKESKQFGALRRQSEALAVKVALKNMATTAGYADDLRLILAMEAELVVQNQQYFDGVETGGYTARVSVDADGKAELLISKGEGGKALKSVPAALKKDETIAEIKEFAAKLKSQYSRCAAMFERAMEEEEAYSLGELTGLCRNPVTAGILGRLVFVSEDGSLAGTLKDLAAEDPAVRLYVAHPITLYRMGELARFQRLFFEMQTKDGTKQPFKQVFREFYPKLAEEKDALDSRLFAGYQIQPKKTLATLKGRGWVADYDEGLQKIYFRQGIAATIYALADWFSPADTESPTLEFVSFYDRKTGRQKKLAEVPDILYSEVMRDVDLVVSVAHVGGVDPETSHSTIEMRRVICGFNMELFGLNNVSFEGTHAFIRGQYDNYTVQLGSGVIHRERGGMVNIVPVHSQQRGKIFLPFVDEDPKTAEILSKILMLAEDRKIKDPYILSQITAG